MATWDFTNPNIAGTSAQTYTGLPDSKPQSVATVRLTLDLNDVGGIGYGDTFASGDVLKISAIPAGWVVLAAGIQIVAAGDTSTTMSLGDTGSATRFISAGSSASTAYLSGLTAHAYTAVDTLEITVGGASVTKGIFYVWALVADMNARQMALPGKL